MIPLQRKQKGHVQGIQYTGANLSDILKCGYFKHSDRVSIDLSNMTINVSDWDGVETNHRAICVNYWIVYDTGGYRILSASQFKDMYET